MRQQDDGVMSSPLSQESDSGDPRTNAPTGTVDRNWTESGGKAPWPGFLLVGELGQVPHYPETRTSPGGYLHRV